MIFETIEDIKDELVRKTKDMRTAQKSYFKYRTNNYLEKAKKLETEVDFLIAKLELRKENLDYEKQATLF